MEIRLAHAEDCPLIGGLFDRFYSYNTGRQPTYYLLSSEDGNLRRIIDSGEADLLLALDDGAVIGLLHIEEKSAPPYETAIPGRYADIIALFVDPTYRGQGIGERLIRAAKKWAKARNLECLELFILEENEIGAEFYSKLGFKTVSRTMRLSL